MTADARAIAAHFACEGGVVAAAPLEGGLINRTYVVTLRTERDTRRIVIQRINERVFPDIEALLRNTALVTAHLRERAPGLVPEPIPTRDGDAAWQAPDGSRWRAARFLDDALPVPHHASRELLYRAAHAFGRFTHALADLAPTRVTEVIPHFHDTPARLAAFDAAAARDPHGRRAECADLIDALHARRAAAHGLVAAHAAGVVPPRIAHNDAKLANVLVRTDGSAVVIDLDTVMPASALVDFGDLARSAACATHEDDPDPSRFRVDPERYEVLRDGFVDGAASSLTSAQRVHLPTAARTLAYEQALRFATDHLLGDVYYRIAYAGQNAVRARGQLALFEDLARLGQ